jgi:hypothetical protein
MHLTPKLQHGWLYRYRGYAGIMATISVQNCCSVNVLWALANIPAGTVGRLPAFDFDAASTCLDHNIAMQVQ